MIFLRNEDPMPDESSYVPEEYLDPVQLLNKIRLQQLLQVGYGRNGLRKHAFLTYEC